MTTTQEPVADAPVEPVAKKAKIDQEPAPAPGIVEASTSGWPDHKMNINKGVMKGSEGKFFSALATADCDVLEGLGDKSKALMEACGVQTVTELAKFKYYKMAKAIAVLAPLEEADGRDSTSVLNCDLAVDLDYETKTLNEILEAPVHALQGVSEKMAGFLGEMEVKTVADLAEFKYCKWAEAIVTMAECEHKLNAKDRKAEAMLKKLE